VISIGGFLREWLVESAQVAGIAAIQLDLRADNAGDTTLSSALVKSECGRQLTLYDDHGPAVQWRVLDRGCLSSSATVCR
jgi:hypothetical protein